MDLDYQDRKLLYALEQNARQTNVALGKTVGVAPDVIQYRIDRLVANGVLKFFMGYINFARLGFVDYGLYLSTQRMTRAEEQSFVEFMTNHPYCPYFCRSGGTYDYVADILARTPIQLMERITEITNTFGQFLYRQEIVTRIHATHFAKQYLLDAASPPEAQTFFGGTTDERMKLDDIDDTILRSLATNARARVSDIAEQAGLSPPAVSQRIKRMEEERLITGYYAWVEPQSYDYHSYNLLLKHQNFTPSDEHELYDFCRTHRHVTWLIKNLGPWDFEINVEVKGQEDLQEVVYELRERFARIIARIEFQPIFRTIKYTQYPFAAAAQAR